MSETENETVAASPEAPAETKKGGGKKFILIGIVLVLLLGGGGAGFYFWRVAGAQAAADEEPEKKAGEKKTSTKKVAEEEPEEADTNPSKKTGAIKGAIPADEDVKTVIELPPFIVNLADTEQARYLRMTVSLGVDAEEGGEKPDALFMTRVRNAMLAVLSEKSSDQILTVEGKAKLRKELLQAAKAASEEPEVKAIYITDFIIQL